MSKASELRRRLDELNEKTADPSVPRDAVKWLEHVLCFKALDALPYLLGIVEGLTEPAAPGNPFVESCALKRVWLNVNHLTKEAGINDTAANCG